MAHLGSGVRRSSYKLGYMSGLLFLGLAHEPRTPHNQDIHLRAQAADFVDACNPTEIAFFPAQCVVKLTPARTGRWRSNNGTYGVEWLLMRADEPARTGIEAERTFFDHV
jgi:hypothetical protein